MTNIITTATASAAALAGYVARRERAIAGPIIAAIEPTSICNLACPLCAAGAGLLTRGRGSMSVGTFDVILDRLPASVRSLYLWGQGEPFCAPGFLAMVGNASARGLTTTTSTNGHFLDDPDAVIDSGLDHLIISLDGADAASYSFYRHGGDFGRVTAGIARLAARIHERRRGPGIEIQCLVHRVNETALRDMRTLADTLGVRRVVFKTLQAASFEGGDAYLPVDEGLTRYAGDHGGVRDTDRGWFGGRRCFRLYYSLQIDWRGGVVPCCFDKDSEHVMGNLLETPFADIWNGARYRDFRALLNGRGRVLPMCRDCTEGLKRRTLHV